MSDERWREAINEVQALIADDRFAEAIERCDAEIASYALDSLENRGAVVGFLSLKSSALSGDHQVQGSYDANREIVSLLRDETHPRARLDTGEALAIASVEAMALGRDDEAKACLAELRDRFRTAPPDVQGQLLDSLIRAARTFAKGGELDEARQIYEVAAAADAAGTGDQTERAGALAELYAARIAANEGRLEDAMTGFQSVFKRGSAGATAYHEFSETMAAGTSEEGRRFFDALGLMGQALALGAQGQLEEPLKLVREVISRYGADEDPLLRRIVGLAREAEREAVDAQRKRPG